jgi:hypothetical protein
MTLSIAGLGRGRGGGENGALRAHAGGRRALRAPVFHVSIRRSQSPRESRAVAELAPACPVAEVDHMGLRCFGTASQPKLAVSARLIHVNTPSYSACHLACRKLEGLSNAPIRARPRAPAKAHPLHEIADKTMRNRTILAAFAACVLAGMAAIASAQAAKAPAPGPNDACLACHGDASAKATSGKPIAVDAAKFAGSVHGSLNLPCNACHTDVSADKFPHGEVKPVDCATCHDKPVKEYAASIHGKARSGGNSVAATCTNCHGTHDILRSSDPASRTNHANLEKTCGACHGNEALIQQAHLPGGNIASQYHDSIHGQTVAGKGPLAEAAPTCTNCHGAHDMRPKSDPASRVARANIPDTCGGCHAGVKEIWSKSHHGQLRQANQLQAPGCTDCHTAHNIKRHDMAEWKLAVVEQCGTCHVDFLDSYRDTFHGQVTQLGFANIATCASCHGGHEVLPKENPLSKVSAQNRVSTCQQCHPKANANFAMYDPHANRHVRQSGDILFFTGKFMDLLLVGVFAFFGAHTLLWFYRSLKDKRARAAAAGGEREEEH